MSKYQLAVLAGGYTGEYEISMKSVQTVLKNIDTETYEPTLIEINKESWKAIIGNETFDIDKNDFSYTREGIKHTFDGVFIVIHGTPGEDGKLQGYFDMLEIPYSTCNSIVSALTFNKSYCNKVVKDFNVVKIAESVHLYALEEDSIQKITSKLSLPVFIKPSESGSSLGVSKVKSHEEILPALQKAFKEDSQVLIEEFIEGREFSIGCFQKNGKTIVLPPSEIISKNEFFDYEAKYTSGVTDEITPAQVPASFVQKIQKTTAEIYKNLGCRGIVRMDFIWKENTDELYFLEVNTMPGQSEMSLVPQQVAAFGMNLKEFYSIILQETLKKIISGSRKK